MKIFTAEKKVAKHEKPTGAIITDSKTYFDIAVRGGYISIKTLQLAGKNKLGILDFLKGFDSKEPYGLIL